MVEIVPYETEYIGNYYSDAVLAEVVKKKMEAVSDTTGNDSYPFYIP